MLNTEGLRYDNEFVKHKVLDAIGDLYLLGHPLIGAVHGLQVGPRAQQRARARAARAPRRVRARRRSTAEDDVPSAFQDWQLAAGLTPASRRLRPASILVRLLLFLALAAIVASALLLPLHARPPLPAFIGQVVKFTICSCWSRAAVLRFRAAARADAVVRCSAAPPMPARRRSGAGASSRGQRGLQRPGAAALPRSRLQRPGCAAIPLMGNEFSLDSPARHSRLAPAPGFEVNSQPSRCKRRQEVGRRCRTTAAIGAGVARRARASVAACHRRRDTRSASGRGR